MSVRTASVELGGDRVLRLARFTDAATDRDVLSMSKGWQEDGPMPGRSGETIEVPGGALAELVEALRELGEWRG